MSPFIRHWSVSAEWAAWWSALLSTEGGKTNESISELIVANNRSVGGW